MPNPAIDAPEACTATICGTCRTDGLDGEPDDRDDFVSAEAKRNHPSVMICRCG